MKLSGLITLLFCLVGGSPVMAQTVQAPGGFAPATGICYGGINGPATCVDAAHPLPAIGLQENFQLVAANVPSTAVTLAGGRYILNQGCASYGSLTLRYRGPDGSTMLAISAGTKTAADSGAATLLEFGAGAIVDVVLSGTNGCNAILARVP